MKHLLIVYHSQSCRTEALAHAVWRGATAAEIDGVEVRLKWAAEADLSDLTWADGVIFGSPENFGYLSGGMKDFLDRTFYPAQGLVDGLPYTAFVSAGNDGTGALRALRRIASGYPLKEIGAPLIARGELSDADLAAATELGMTVAAGLELGIF